MARDDDIRTDAADAAEDFEFENPALWGLLGTIEETRPSDSFIRRCVSQAKGRSARRRWPLRPSIYGGLGAAAAALLIALFLQRGDDGRRDEQATDGQAPLAATRSPVKDADTKTLESLFDSLADLSETEDLALDVETVQDVNESWFGG